MQDLFSLRIPLKMDLRQEPPNIGPVTICKTMCTCDIGEDERNEDVIIFFARNSQSIKIHWDMRQVVLIASE